MTRQGRYPEYGTTASSMAVWDRAHRMQLQLTGVTWRSNLANRYATRPIFRLPLTMDSTCRDLIAVMQAQKADASTGALLTEDQRLLATHFDIASQLYDRQAVRNAVDALLLSGMSDEQIAALMACDANTIATYADCFFDVRWILSAPDAIACHVFHPSAADNQPERVALLKLAYRGGPEVALGCVDFLAHYQECHDLSTAAGMRRHAIAKLVLLEAAEQFASDSKYRVHLAEVLTSCSYSEHREKGLASVLSQRLDRMSLPHFQRTRSSDSVSAQPQRKVMAA